MPLNLTKEYHDLLDIIALTPTQRTESLMRIFVRDIEENQFFTFRGKQIRPMKKKEGDSSMKTLFHHLTTKEDRDAKGKKLKSRSFENGRSQRLHWCKYHIEERKKDGVIVFSYMDKIDGRGDTIRTYIYDTTQDYVIILEPQRTQKDYYLITAYHLNEPGGKKQIERKLKRRLSEIF